MAYIYRSSDFSTRSLYSVLSFIDKGGSIGGETGGVTYTSERSDKRQELRYYVVVYTFLLPEKIKKD